MLFMLAGPDCARVVEEFEAIHDLPPSSTGHHEEGREGSGQLGNPFFATSLELVVLDTQNVMEESLWHHFLKYVKLVKHFTPHTSEKGWKIHLFQYLISSSETTC